MVGSSEFSDGAGDMYIQNTRPMTLRIVIIDVQYAMPGSTQRRDHDLRMSTRAYNTNLTHLQYL